jgi:uncharacterized protein (TIGR00288 family)
LKRLGALDYRKLSLKLTKPRDWIETRYYVGRVLNSGNNLLYDEQRRFIERICRQDSKISTHFGRLEKRVSRNEAAEEILAYLGNLSVEIDKGVYQSLIEIAQRHRSAEVMVEKAVDVMIAVDLVSMAQNDEFDVAYLLSADGDFTPAVVLVQSLGKKVFGVSAQHGAQLAAQTDTFIRIRRDWFDDCFAD